MTAARYAVGDRVIVPDPRVVNPLGASRWPHGPGRVAEVIPPHRTGAPRHRYRVELDAGGEHTCGEVFLRPELES